MSNEKIDRGWVEFSEEECKGCGLCVTACPPEVIQLSDRFNAHGYHPADYLGSGCTGCGICFFACPEPGAITVYRLESPKAVAAQTQTPLNAAYSC